MTYYELIDNIADEENLVISKKNYSEQCFGDFVVELKYKRKLMIQMLNDRNIVEIFIVMPTLFSSKVVPLKYAVNYVRRPILSCEEYVFNGVEEAYCFLQNSYKVLDEIISNDMMKSIVYSWNNSVH